MKVFGFDKASLKIDDLINNAKTVGNVLEKEAENIKNEAVKIAESKGLKVTGAGTSGIVTKTTGLKSIVGWSGRPNLHLYFHEKGFHAGWGKATGRFKRGSRKRTYKKGRVYIAPKPHVKPATMKFKDKAINNIAKHITGGKI